MNSPNPLYKAVAVKGLLGFIKKNKYTCTNKPRYHIATIARVQTKTTNMTQWY